MSCCLLCEVVGEVFLKWASRMSLLSANWSVANVTAEHEGISRAALLLC